VIWECAAEGRPCHLYFLMEAQCILCAVRTESVYIMRINFSLQRIKHVLTSFDEIRIHLQGSTLPYAAQSCVFIALVWHLISVLQGKGLAYFLHTVKRT
jgi:hypothetical protein